jgi:DDE superfamily endonuclease
MPSVPCWIADLLSAFAPLFSNRAWQHPQILLAGAILAPDKRTVTSALRVMGLSSEAHFQNDQRVLNRAGWSSLNASRTLLHLLIVESQRQWSDLAIARATPVLFGLFSLVRLLAHHRWGGVGFKVRQAAWYEKSLPTFSDALAEVGRALWSGTSFQTSCSEREILEVPRVWLERRTDALYCAA